MWLPAPAYERIPHFWFLLGVLFMIYGLYVGMDIANSLVYVGFGMVCCAVGAGVAVLRRQSRNRQSADNRPEQSDSSSSIL